jgi:hypothetical protein
VFVGLFHYDATGFGHLFLPTCCNGKCDRPHFDPFASFGLVPAFIKYCKPDYLIRFVKVDARGESGFSSGVVDPVIAKVDIEPTIEIIRHI